jgi:serine/threonine-protein kinase
VLRGTTVSVVVSDGPAPREVPNVIGLPFDDASQQMRDMQLKVVRGDDVFSDSIEKGAVATQSIPGGESVRRGTEVVLTVSKGPDLVTVPRVQGLDFAGVRNALAEAGLEVGEVSGDRRNGRLLRMTVDGERVGAGDVLRRGTTVDLEYSEAPPRSTTTTTTTP